MSQRVSMAKRMMGVRAGQGKGASLPRDAAGSGITLHCTVPYEGTGPEDIVHRFDDGTLITEARDFLNARRVFYYYSGGQGAADPLVNEGIIGTHPEVSPAFDPDYMQMTNDISVAVRFRTLQPSNPNATQFAVLTMSPTSVIHPTFTTLINHAPTLGYFDQIVVLNPTTLLLVNVGNFGLNLNTCVVTRNGASLTAGAVQSQASGFSDLSPNDYRVVRVNDTTAYLVAPDLGDPVPPDEYVVKGLTLTVSGMTTALGELHSMHPGINQWPQISPIPSGAVVVGMQTDQTLHGLNGPFLKYSVWAVNPLTGVSGPQVHLDYEMTGVSGFMQPTGKRQAAAIWHGIDPTLQTEEVPGIEEVILGLTVDVAADLTVTPTVNLVSPPGMSDFDYMIAGHGTDVGMVRMWHDRTRARGHLYADAQSWFGNFGGVSHYTVGGGPRSAVDGVVRGQHILTQESA